MTDDLRTAAQRVLEETKMTTINWKRVSERLRCPKCGERAHIMPETDGTEAWHEHRFTLTREEAARLSNEAPFPDSSQTPMTMERDLWPFDGCTVCGRAWREWCLENHLPYAYKERDDVQHRLKRINAAIDSAERLRASSSAVAPKEKG